MEDSDKKNTMPDGAESTGIEDMNPDEITGKVTDDAHAEAAAKLAEDNGDTQDPQALPEDEKSPEEIDGDRRALAAQVRVSQPKKKFDETIPGGRIMTRSGRLLNSSGQPITEDGKVLGDQPGVLPGGNRPLGA
jgi:hypothetical protein